MLRDAGRVVVKLAPATLPPHAVTFKKLKCHDATKGNSGRTLKGTTLKEGVLTDETVGAGVPPLGDAVGVAVADICETGVVELVRVAAVDAAVDGPAPNSPDMTRLSMRRDVEADPGSAEMRQQKVSDDAEGGSSPVSNLWNQFTESD